MAALSGCAAQRVCVAAVEPPKVWSCCIYLETQTHAEEGACHARHSQPCHAAAPRRVYARVRRPAALAFRLYGGGGGAAFQLLRLFFDAVDEPTAMAPLGMARHAALLLMASSVAPLLLWASAPLPLG